jgi:SAM-dependent methyltransferase
MSRSDTGTSLAGAAVPAAPAGWRADPYTTALTTGKGPLSLRSRDGRLLSLCVERWCAGPGAGDRTVIERCEGAVLDIGCGPGRFVTALARAGHRTLGIDVSPAAVRRTLRNGGSALVRSVFDPVPREGRWNTALLVDGNIGIGGDPATLLGRAADVLAPGGLLVTEVAADDVDERLDVRFDDGIHRPAEDGFFPWARVGARALLHRADGTGRWSGWHAWHAEGRSFVALRREGALSRTPAGAPSPAPSVARA